MSPEQEYSPDRPDQSDDAERPFTGRSEYVRKFVDVLQRQDLQESRVLVYHGMGGIGKSRLVKELGGVLDGETEIEYAEALDELRHHSWFCSAKIDFHESNPQDPARSLYHLRTRLLKKYGYRFPTFDIAFAEYWSKAYQAVPLPKPDPSVLEEHGDLIVEIWNLLEEVPAAGIMARLPKQLGELSREAKKWYRKRNEEALQEILSLQSYEIEKRLPGFWTYDFKREISQDKRSAVFFLDTYEALQENRRSERHWHRADQWVREWISGLEEATVLITGRYQLRWSEINEEWGAILEQQEMKEMGPEDSRCLLKRSGIEEEAIREHIVEAMSGIPYELELAVDFYEEIKRQNKEPKPEDFGDTPRKLSESFFQYLGNNEAAMLELLAVPRSFDEDIVGALADEFDSGFPTGQFVRLERFSFVNRIGEDGRGQSTFSLHDRARDALREHAEFYKEPEIIHEFLFDYHREKLEDLKPSEVNPRDEQSLQEAFYHGQQFLKVEELGKWFFEKEPVFTQAARWQMLEELHERLLDLQKSAFGDEHPQVGQTLNNLATFCWKQGKYEEAELLYERALEIRKTAHGKKDLQVGQTLNNLAKLYWDEGRLEEAEPLYEQALEIQKITLGEEDPQVAETLNNLAVLYRKQGKYEEAEPLYGRALEIRESALGEEHPQVAETLSNLGVFYEKRGKYEEAEPLYGRALEIRESALGEDHPEVAETLNNLAVLYQKQGKYEEAEPLYDRALGIQKSTLGKGHPHVALTLNNIGSLYRRQERYEEAEPLYDRALGIQESALGKDHFRVAETLKNLAFVYREQERYEEAGSLYDRALEVEESTLGGEHPRVATTLNNFAVLYRKQGKPQEAEALHERALGIQESALGKQHPRITETLKELALLYAEQERQEEANQLLERALAIARQKLREAHPKTQEISSSLKTLRGGEEE